MTDAHRPADTRRPTGVHRSDYPDVPVPDLPIHEEPPARRRGDAR